MKITISIPGEEIQEIDPETLTKEQMFEAGQLFSQAQQLPKGAKFRMESQGLYYEVGKI